jgi:NADP-dependent 3-hydroxy acid dehydrogenase YdfG
VSAPRTAAITGASSGIGAAVGRALAERGYNVGLASRATGVDVRDPERLEAFLAALHAEYGSVDVLVVNAGVGMYGPAVEQRHRDNREMVETNVLGFINTIQAALPYLYDSGRADLVGITSTAGLSVTGNSATYTATKHAQVAYLRAIDAELGRPEFRVTNIAPGNVNTRFAIGYGRVEGMPQLDDMLTPEEVASQVVTAIELPRETRLDTVAIRPTRRFRA